MRTKLGQQVLQQVALLRLEGSKVPVQPHLEKKTVLVQPHLEEGIALVQLHLEEGTVLEGPYNSELYLQQGTILSFALKCIKHFNERQLHS